MAKVFISYSRKDIEFAKKLTGELQKSELDFWIDWEGIPPTVDWWKEIEKGIEEADIFLFLISPDSAKSKICGQEIDVAVKNGKRIVPIVVREIIWEDTPPQLGHLNYIFFNRDDDFDTAVKKLMTAIHTDYEWAATHRRLQVKALDWERNRKDNGFLLRGRDLLDAEQDLATNTSKEPHPTDLQREYVFKSRRAFDRQRRIITSAAIVGVIALTVLTVFSIIKAGQATNAQGTAEANLIVAQTAQADAENRENARATAQALAEERANIALARQLAAQSQALVLDTVTSNIQSGLLAVEAGRRGGGWGANQALRSFLTATFLPVAHPAIILVNQGEYVTAVEFSPDGRFFLSTGGATVRVWETATGRESAHMDFDSGVSSVHFSPDSQYVLSGSPDGIAAIWSATTGTEIVRFIHEGGINSVAFSSNGKYVASGGDDSSARVWDVATGRQIAQMDHQDVVTSIAFNPDNENVISGSEDHTIIIWQAATGKEVTRLTHDEPVNFFVMSTDGQRLASVSGDGLVHVWDVRTGRQLVRISDNAFQVALSPDGRYVVTASGDFNARVWDVVSGQEIALLTHTDAVVSVAISPDSRYVVTGSGGSDWTARVWEITTGREMARNTHDEYVGALVFSADGKYIASGGGDQLVRIWYWQMDDMITAACQSLTRNFFHAEWIQYLGDEPYQATCPNLPIEPDVSLTPTVIP